MESRLKGVISFYDGLNWEELDEESRKAYASKLLTQIQFLQHERLIHLIVTVLFVFLAMFAIFGAVFSDNYMFYGLTIAVFVLLIPYIRHYYILENGIQKLYRVYDRINGEKY